MGTGTYILSTWLFLRFLGLIYLIAFASLLPQIKGLVGKNGILPAAFAFRRDGQNATALYLRLPTLCWWSTSDRFLIGQVCCGLGLSLLLIIGIAPILVLISLWLLYLSLLHVGDIFLSYQWDALLLETGFLAILAAPLELAPSFPPVTNPSPVARWLLLWLLFRLIFSSGVTKLRSRDPTWRNLTALQYHYETQPLPTRVSWYAHQLPAWFQKFSVAILFFIELIAPFLLFAPVPLNQIAAGLIVYLMLLIELTGNYGFFNLLAIALAIPVFDDAAFLSVFGGIVQGWLSPVVETAPTWWNIMAALAGILLIILSVGIMMRVLVRRDLPWPAALGNVLIRLRPFRLVSSYGLFAVMTTSRQEIILEGSVDGECWQAYEFKWKAGDLRRPPRFVAPHQPRLDWQMWFVALGGLEASPWLTNFARRLLQGSPEVIQLLKKNPFPKQPPKFVRARVYDYHFTDFQQRRRTGEWWRRERTEQYLPPIKLW